MAEETKPKRRRGRRPRRGLPKELPEIFFCGDPHGEFAHINEAAREFKPKAMVILGDLQPPASLEEVLAEALEHTEIWWIPGNHDTDTDEFYDRLWRSPLASHNLHGRVANVAGVRIAGLGGVFRGQVWMPDGQPNYFCPATFIRRVGAGNIWRGGLPRRHRSTIFPSVYQSLLRQKADVLVTHEAAGCHRKGFCAVDRLGESLKVKWIFHGHQHEDRVYGEHLGMAVRAVGYRGIVNLKGEVIVPAQMDPRESAALESALEYAARSYPTTGTPLPGQPLVFDSGESTEDHELTLGREVARHAPGGRWKPAVVPEFLRNPESCACSDRRAGEAMRRQLAKAKEQERAEEKAERKAERAAQRSAKPEGAPNPAEGDEKKNRRVRRRRPRKRRREGDAPKGGQPQGQPKRPQPQGAELRLPQAPSKSEGKPKGEGAEVKDARRRSRRRRKPKAPATPQS